MTPTFSEWAAMDGLGVYIWSAYGAAFLIIAVLACASRQRLRDAARRLAEAEQDSSAA